MENWYFLFQIREMDPKSMQKELRGVTQGAVTLVSYLKTNQIKSGRVDINVLKSKLQETESKEFKKNLFVLSTLVLGLDIGSNIPLKGLIATIIALISITLSTIWQKKFSKNLPLVVSNFYQAFGGCLFHILIIIFLSPYKQKI